MFRIWAEADGTFERSGARLRYNLRVHRTNCWIFCFFGPHTYLPKRGSAVCVSKGSGEQRNFEIHCWLQLARKSHQTFCKGEEMNRKQRLSLHLDGDFCCNHDIGMTSSKLHLDGGKTFSTQAWLRPEFIGKMIHVPSKSDYHVAMIPLWFLAISVLMVKNLLEEKRYKEKSHIWCCR